jgi:hypothetical protein
MRTHWYGSSEVDLGKGHITGIQRWSSRGFSLLVFGCIKGSFRVGFEGFRLQFSDVFSPLGY